MATEQSPLLQADELQHYPPIQDGVYDRFSRKQKGFILAIISFTEFIPMFVRGCFVPSIPQISKDLDATPAAVSLGVSVVIFTTAFSMMFWSGYSSFYGRRTVYLCGMPITILGSFAVAMSPNLTSLLIWRFVQAFGCTGNYVIGSATIGDIYKSEERGTAMGIFAGATLFALAIAPLVGGIFTQYLSWRTFHAALGVWGIIQTLLLFIFLPETAHPGTRGVDKVQSEKKAFVWINPFRCLAFLRSPNIIVVALANSLVFVPDLVLLMPIAYTIGAKYGITSESLIGVLFLASGLGNVVGAPIGGHLSDAVVLKAKDNSNRTWVPEERLRAAWLVGLVLVPTSVTLAGFATAYINGAIGLVINLVCLFNDGTGVNIVLNTIGAYAVDIMPSRSAEVVAAISAFRSLFLAALSTLCIPTVETIGVVATNTIAGILALIGYLLIWLTIRYGEQMRACVDVGYPDFRVRESDCDDGTPDN